jgi:hypothetical protein
MLGWLVQQTPEQRQAAMAAAARAATAEHVRPPPRRPVGRPAKRPVVQLESAADEPEQKKRKYTQWFSLPLIHDILAAYRVCSYSARATVAYLQRSHLEIYADLTESTVRSWFDASTHQLHPQFERLLITREYATPAGPKRVFDGFPEAEHKIMEIMMKMRSRVPCLAAALHSSRGTAEFRASLPRYIHLVYVPANCTSMLQVADVALNYPFKHGFKRRFNQWAAEVIRDQIDQNAVVGIKQLCGMTMIKPKVLEWALESWKCLRDEKVLIQKGWNKCVVSLYDVTSQQERLKAMRDAVRHDFDPDLMPEEKEEEVDSDGYCCEESSDEEKSEKQIMKERIYGERKSSRAAQPRQSFGYVLNSEQLKFS